MRLAVVAVVLVLAGILLILFGMLWGVVLVWAAGMACFSAALTLALLIIRREHHGH